LVTSPETGEDKKDTTCQRQVVTPGEQPIGMNPVDLDAKPCFEDLRWHGWLPRFSSIREGGPGKPVTLLLWSLITLGMGGWGLRTMDRDGIDSGGPAMILIAVTLLVATLLWLLIKAWLRPLEVTFSVTQNGVEAIPTKRQQHLDRGMRIISLVTFWLTLKGGQWSPWHPTTRWKEIRSVDIDTVHQELLIRGGVWDIRLTGAGDRFDQLCKTIHTQVPKRTRFTHHYDGRFIDPKTQ